MIPTIRAETNDGYIWKMVFDDNLYGLKNLDGAVVIDVGAHIGSFTSKAIALGAKAVICVEPNPENFTCLKRNTSIHSDVTYRLAALDYGEAELVPISAPDGKNTGRIYSGGDAMHLARYLVPQIRLKDLLELLPNGRANLLKLDCQGGEWQAFNEEPASTWMSFDEIIGEIHADLHIEHFLSFLNRQGGGRLQTLELESLGLRDWAIRGVRRFAKAHGFETVFSLDEEDINSAEFYASRPGGTERCGLVADA
jgi:FkbM family methyltransferase